MKTTTNTITLEMRIAALHKAISDLESTNIKETGKAASPRLSGLKYALDIMAVSDCSEFFAAYGKLPSYEDIAKYVFFEAAANSSEGNWIVSLDEIDERFNVELDYSDYEAISDKLYELFGYAILDVNENEYEYHYGEKEFDINLGTNFLTSWTEEDDEEEWGYEEDEDGNPAIDYQDADGKRYNYDRAAVEIMSWLYNGNGQHFELSVDNIKNRLPYYENVSEACIENIIDSLKKFPEYVKLEEVMKDGYFDDNLNFVVTKGATYVVLK